MERQVIFRDRQELQPADLNNIEAFGDESLRNVMADAITSERQIVGMAVTQKSATEIEIAPGRLYDGPSGKVFALRDAQDESIFSQLPIADEKWLAVSVIGQEIETDVQPRDFLIDLQSGQTQPEAVPMELRRNAVVSITAGVESSTPQKPAAPTGYTLLAYIRLNTSGIQEIELSEVFALPNLQRVNARVDSVESWRDVAEPSISTLRSDVSNLAAEINDPVNKDQFVEVAGDVALLKEQAEVNTGASSYGADYFLNEDASDTADLTYYARVDEGIRFPFDGETELVPTLFNPYDSGVRKFGGFILPEFQGVTRMRTDRATFSGELSIADYQVQSHNFKKRTRTRKRVRYGPYRRVCTNSRWWKSGRYDVASGLFYKNGDVYEYDGLDVDQGNKKLLNGTKIIRIRKIWTDTVTEPYWSMNTTTTTYNGAQIAQTMLNSQSGWMNGITLYFTKKDSVGIVNVMICETENGLPKKDKTLSETQVEIADINLHPLGTVVRFPEPVYLEAGKRYAIVLTTQGAHRLAVVSGTEYTEGTIFYSLDGEYYQGDFTKDLMFRANFCKFQNTRQAIQFNGLDLSGGIGDLDFLHEVVVPDATEFTMEYQKDGVWYPVDESTADQLTGLPALLPLRAVFLGSSDLMPGFNMAGSVWRGARLATNFRHVSEERIIPVASTQIIVKTLLEGFDDTYHTFEAKLEIGGGEVIASSVVDTIEDTGIKRVSTFDLASSTTAYKVICEGTSSSALADFHVAFRIDVAM